jgi:hypothetical protein
MELPPPSVPARRRAARRVPMALGAPRHVAVRDTGVTTARRWTAGGLGVSTAALLVAVVWFLEAFDATAGLGVRGVLSIASMVLPGVLVGWCTGFATLALLVRDELFHPRLVGLVAALVGSVLGAALLPLAGVG